MKKMVRRYVTNVFFSWRFIWIKARLASVVERN